MRSPANAGPSELPASSALTCASVRSLTAPVPSVVRSTVASCRITISPSFVGPHVDLDGVDAHRDRVAERRERVLGKPGDSPRWLISVTSEPG
jgi:hypothetical protein